MSDISLQGVTFSSLILQLSLYLAAGLTPGFGRLKDDGASEQLQISYDRSIRWLTMLLLPVSLGGAVIMPELIPLVFGKEFLPAVPVAVVLVLFSLPQALYGVPTSAMLAHEEDRRLLYVNAVAAAALVALNLVITPFFGGVGAAAIRAATGIGIFAWLVLQCHRSFDLRIDLGALLRILVCGLACAAVAYLVLSPAWRSDRPSGRDPRLGCGLSAHLEVLPMPPGRGSGPGPERP